MKGMGQSKLIYSFRARLLLIFALLLVTTLGVQYQLNEWERQRVARIIEEQEQALAAGFSLAIESLSSPERLADLSKKKRATFLEREADRLINILIVDDVGAIPDRLDPEDRVTDSLDPKYNPQQQPDGSFHYFRLGEVPLPPIIEAEQNPTGAGSGATDLLSAYVRPTEAGKPRAFPFPVLTDQGRSYIIIILGSASASYAPSPWRVIRPLLPTLAILLLATLVAALLVWRFTRPIRELSQAAKRIAAGDFDFQVPAANRRDEMGELAAVFNEMIAGLRRMRQLEVELHQAERSAVIGRLASAIAHEIRNPLNYINLTLDHLRTQFNPTEPEKRAVFERLTKQVKDEVARANARITELLSYSRPSRLKLRPLELRPIIEDVLRTVEVQAAENGIAIHLEEQTASPQVLGDAESLRSLFSNLIINGLQAMDGHGGELTIAIAPAEDGRVRVLVKDTGQGIPPEDLPHLFEPYFSTKETGTGLGLAIVKKAVEDHGGTIQVESRVGQGTTFTVTLPAASDEAHRRDAES
jgi:signal transduction histidine kinase